jgi:hypothetical protein
MPYQLAPLAQYVISDPKRIVSPEAGKADWDALRSGSDTSIELLVPVNNCFIFIRLN